MMLGKMIAGEVSLKTARLALTIADYAWQSASAWLAGPIEFPGAHHQHQPGVLNRCRYRYWTADSLNDYVAEIVKAARFRSGDGCGPTASRYGLLVRLMAFPAF